MIDMKIDKGHVDMFVDGAAHTLASEATVAFKYNKCPFCRSYAIQGNLCYGCKWRFGHGQYAKETDFDLFDPKESWRELMNREVDR